MALSEAAPAPAPGPSSKLRSLPVVLWRPASREGQRQARIMDASAGAQWLRRVSQPSCCCPYRDAVFARATHCGPLPEAVPPSTPLTKAERVNGAWR